MGERLERISEAQDRENVRKMAQISGQAAKRGDDDSDDEEGGQKRSSRSRKATGVTSEKAKGLEKLRAKRQEKGKKKDAQVRRLPRL